MPAKAKLLLIVMDGCRPDALQQANTPRIDTLWQNGAYTWNARTVMPSVTLPSHSTMFRGVSPQKHGVREDNIYRPSAGAFPSITDVAKLGNKRTAMFYSWEQLRDLAARARRELRAPVRVHGARARVGDRRLDGAAADHVHGDLGRLLAQQRERGGGGDGGQHRPEHDAAQGLHGSDRSVPARRYRSPRRPLTMP